MKDINIGFELHNKMQKQKQGGSTGVQATKAL